MIAAKEHMTASEPSRSADDLRIFVFGLFFIFGGITSLNDVLIPKLKGLFSLSYAEVMLVQSAFFAAYFIVSLPAAAIVERIGYMRTATLGLLTTMVGCLLFVPASSSGIFAMFLLALFVLAAGITIVQVVANPLISMLGAPATAPSRLTFAQAFNSLGTTLFPYVGAIVILGSLTRIDASTLSGAALNAFRAAETKAIEHAYLGLAAALLIIAGAVWSRRKSLIETPVVPGNILKAFSLLLRPRFGFGSLCIFLYVGAEVAIGSMMVSYLTQPGVNGHIGRGGRQALDLLLGRARWWDASSVRISCGFSPPGRCSHSWRRWPSPCCCFRRSSTGLPRGGSCSRSGCSTRSCFPRYFRSLRKASQRGRPKVPGSSAWRSSERSGGPAAHGTRRRFERSQDRVDRTRALLCRHRKLRLVRAEVAMNSPQPSSAFTVLPANAQVPVVAPGAGV